MAQGDGGAASPALNDDPKISDVSIPAASPQPSPSATTQPPTEPSPATLGADDDDDPPPPPKSAPKLCGVCNTQPGKYKCPRPGCAMPYCSIPCHKSHKENHPADPPSSQPALPPPQLTNSSNFKDPYQVLLDHAHVFDRLFKKYPSLPSALNSIQSQTLPPPPPSTATPSFLQGSNSNPRKRKEPPWSKDVGLRKGADALRKARTDPTDTGDGVREYCDLVLYLLSLGNEKDREVQEPRPLAERAVREVREEVWREERRVVESLLKEEEGA
ncbi:hypothetical protein QBC36DRAFT_313759 [Triangularia setosa]|uniref:C2H2-type domain-containing protein n=1 Tax=Triangularia setosa TaxID=2587417 RepID=A0AAN6W4M5_9PEZI|nr:hypothetical protein QBC36DRAFT_313759 [Podospora setosa]